MKSTDIRPAGVLSRLGRICWKGKGAAIALALGTGAAALTGCAGTIGAEGGVVYGHPAVYAEVVPPDITMYPRVYYRGRYAYLVDGEWYYPSARGWVVFRQEPVELRTYRSRHYRTSPRYVPPERDYGYPRERPRRRYTRP